MGQLIQFGQKAQDVKIEHFDCAQGVTVKGAFLNYTQPYVRNLAWDETNKCTVECTREMALKYKLNPTNCYFFLVASFATDVNGNVIGDKEIKVTYMRMKGQQYDRFLAASNNIGEWNGLVTLSKVQKKGDGGKDYSFVEAIPASDKAKGFDAMSQQLKERIQKLSEDKDVLNISIQMIDNATGLYEDRYLERIQQNKQKALQQGEQQAPQAVQQPQSAYVAPSVAQATPAAQLPPQTSTVQQPQPTAQQVTAPVDDFAQPTNGEDLPF